MKLFLSYSSKDETIALSIKRALDALGASVWFAPESIKAGKAFDEEIERALQNIDAFILLASCHSVGNKSLNMKGSSEVKSELKIARQNKFPIIPLNMDDSVYQSGDGFSYLLINYQNIDIQQDIKHHNFESLSYRLTTIIRTTQQDEKTAQAMILNEWEDDLKHIERLLKETHYSSSRLKPIAINTCPSPLKNKAELLNIIISLRQQNLTHLAVDDMEKYVHQLQQLIPTNMKTPTCYTLGLLSHYYYKHHALYDITGGIHFLKQKASGKSPEASYIQLIGNLSPNNDNFFIRWRRTPCNIE